MYLEHNEYLTIDGCCCIDSVLKPRVESRVTVKAGATSKLQSSFYTLCAGGGQLMLTAEAAQTVETVFKQAK